MGSCGGLYRMSGHSLLYYDYGFLLGTAKDPGYWENIRHATGVSGL